MKAANADKKFAKQLESTLAEEAEARRKRSESFSLPAPTSDTEAAGVDGSTGMPHRTLLHLIATLNAAYPDYDFRSVHADAVACTELAVPSVAAWMPGCVFLRRRRCHHLYHDTLCSTVGVASFHLIPAAASDQPTSTALKTSPPSYPPSTVTCLS